MLQAMATALALRRQSWSRLGLYLCVFAVAAETVQLLTLDRTSQVADAGLNILGVITGLALGAILRRLKKMFATASLAHFNSETVLWPRVFQGAQALGRGTAEAQGHFAPPAGVQGVWISRRGARYVSRIGIGDDKAGIIGKNSTEKSSGTAKKKVATIQIFPPFLIGAKIYHAAFDLDNRDMPLAVKAGQIRAPA